MADSAGKATKQVKREGSGGDSDDNVPISAMNRGKKKVEDSDDDDELPLAASRAKKKSAEGKKGGVKGNAVPSKVKKEESEDSNFKDDMKKQVKKDNRKGKENQNKNSSSGNVKTEKVKKVYDLPGQKHNPPEERDPLRIFYETLYDQVPNSEIAAFWMMERGLLPEDEAKKVFQKKKQKGILSPAKPTSANKVPASNTVKRSLDTSSTKKGKTGTSKDSAAKSKKRKADSDSEEDSDDDFVDAPKLNPRKRQKVSN